MEEGYSAEGEVGRKSVLKIPVFIIGLFGFGEKEEVFIQRINIVCKKFFQVPWWWVIVW